MNAFWKSVLALTCLASLVCCYLLIKTDAPSKKIDIANPQYRVSYSYAKQCIDDYKRTNSSTTVTSFLIERQDFLQSLGMDSSTAGAVISPYSYVRGYIGYDQRANSYHMFFTPVDSVIYNSAGQLVYAGKDVVLKGRRINPRYNNQGVGAGAGDPGDEDPFVLDLNAPCPTTCNFQSMFDSTSHH